MTFHDPFVAQYAGRDGWGNFLPLPAPLAAGSDPIESVTRKMQMSRHPLPLDGNKIWDGIAARINAYPFVTSDQCSHKHYRDVFEFMRLNNGSLDRVVECGVFHGGMSAVLAGCAVAFNFTLDLIDVDPGSLTASYHRMLLTFPEAAGRIRLFWGELPNYVKQVRDEPDFSNAVLHHDGSHQFNVVMRDLASLYYIREKLHAVLIQDTHLRYSNPDNYCFVDAAVAAVFGIDPHYQPLGITFSHTTHPEGYQRGKKDNVYFVANQPEGMMLPIAANTFRYPHVLNRIDDFIKFPSKPAMGEDQQVAVAAE